MHPVLYFSYISCRLHILKAQKKWLKRGIGCNIDVPSSPQPDSVISEYFLKVVFRSVSEMSVLQS